MSSAKPENGRVYPNFHTTLSTCNQFPIWWNKQHWSFTWLSHSDPLYGTVNGANASIEGWLGTQPTSDLLHKDPFELLYGDVWSNMTGVAQESLVWNWITWCTMYHHVTVKACIYFCNPCHHIPNRPYELKSWDAIYIVETSCHTIYSCTRKASFLFRVQNFKHAQ